MSDSAAVLPAYDVAIVGAGPAGTACALALRGSGLRVALLDKATFPRDKVCGDAVPGHALKALRQLDPAYTDALWQLQPRDDVRRSRLVAPSGGSFYMHWKLPTFNSPRLSFDAALLALVRQHTATEVLESAALKTIAITADCAHLHLADGREIRAGLVVGCDGANSVVGRRLLPEARLARAHHSAGVRAYFENVAGAESGTTEFFFSRNHLAGYLWLFPVGAGRYNVGLGMLSELVAKHKIDLKKLLLEQLATHPGLASRFREAQQIGPIRGFGLPMGGGRQRPASGARFLLCGDAASLIDPLQGHGIDLAIRSGIMAAAQVRECVAKQDFSAAFMAKYDAELQRRLGPQLAHSYRLQRLLGTRPWLMNLGTRLAQLPGLGRWAQRLVG
ncbi:NAD(P)/FAD-dependent oxidoreductase [Hymenobacter cheonanensis]|uniref:NAD(P)/FAD-dependent oxidoreductase n=1 Tax=Hymenobacter sp. CA2-7 TaxID=3063993 RepID=UPI002713920E|nr:NAD(P)/FAD-dependent oxidoreductase [Hymenobacter sp. CA2-7]MDO7886880.1 NAD(P)/FAD-dependent oxidoreductase [Hymenobacter sp. CA2-7]